MTPIEEIAEYFRKSGLFDEGDIVVEPYTLELLVGNFDDRKTEAGPTYQILKVKNVVIKQYTSYTIEACFGSFDNNDIGIWERSFSIEPSDPQWKEHIAKVLLDMICRECYWYDSFDGLSLEEKRNIIKKRQVGEKYGGKTIKKRFKDKGFIMAKGVFEYK